MECIKCKREIQDDFSVCPYCGTKVVENGIICKSCNEVVKNEGEYCPKCGKRLDGKLECPNCHSIIEDDYAYCPKCATALRKGTKTNVSNVASHSNVTKSAIVTNSSLNIKDFFSKYGRIIKKSVLLAVSLIVFIFSFLNIYSIEYTMSEALLEEFDIDSSKEIKIEGNYSFFDAIEVIGLKKDYDVEDFYKEYSREIERIDYSYDDLSDGEIEAIMNEFFKDTSILKFIIANTYESDSSVDFSKTVKNICITQTVLTSILLMAAAGYVSYSIGQLYFAITSKKKSSYDFPFGIVIVAIGIATILLSPTIGFDFTISGFYVAMIALSLSAVVFEALCKFATKLFNREYKISDLCVIPRLVFVCVALGFCFASTMNITYRYERDEIRMEYDAEDFISMRYVEAHVKSMPSDVYDEMLAENVIVLDNYGLVDIESQKTTFNPVFTKHLVDSRIVTDYDDVIFASNIVLLVLVALIIIAIMLQLFDNKKKTSLIVNSVVTIIALLYLVLNIVMASEYKQFTHLLSIDTIDNVKVGASSIVIFIMSALMAITSLLEYAVSKKKEIVE